MAKLKKYGLTFHSNSWLCPKKFLGITLFGHVFTYKKIHQLEEYLATPNGHRFANHEAIHILQSKSFKTSWVGFYLYYIWYWFMNLFKYGFTKNSYYNIPFEREAYANEWVWSYIDGIKESNWKKYKGFS